MHRVIVSQKLQENWGAAKRHVYDNRLVHRCNSVSVKKESFAHERKCVRIFACYVVMVYPTRTWILRRPAPGIICITIVWPSLAFRCGWSLFLEPMSQCQIHDQVPRIIVSGSPWFPLLRLELILPIAALDVQKLKRFCAKRNINSKRLNWISREVDREGIGGTMNGRADAEMNIVKSTVFRDYPPVAVWSCQFLKETYDVPLYTNSQAKYLYISRVCFQVPHINTLKHPRATLIWRVQGMSKGFTLLRGRHVRRMSNSELRCTIQYKL